MTTELCIQKLFPDFVKENTRYLVCDYYNDNYYTDVKAEEVLRMQSIAPHGANVFKIAKMSNKPQMVSSTGHYSIGGEFCNLEFIKNKLHYEVENYFDMVIDYQILLPNGLVVLLQIEKGFRKGGI